MKQQNKMYSTRETLRVSGLNEIEIVVHHHCIAICIQLYVYYSLVYDPNKME